MSKKRVRIIEWERTDVVDENQVKISEDENSLNVRYNPDVLEHAVGSLLWPAREAVLTENERDILDELRGVDVASLLLPQETKVLVQFVIQKKTIAQIGDAIGLSRQRVSAILKNIGKKIRRYLKIE